jgi:hypothetical protein
VKAWDSRTLPGRLMRLPLRCIPEEAVVPVLSGSLEPDLGADVGSEWLAEPC